MISYLALKITPESKYKEIREDFKEAYAYLNKKNPQGEDTSDYSVEELREWIVHERDYSKDHNPNPILNGFSEAISKYNSLIILISALLILVSSITGWFSIRTIFMFMRDLSFSISTFIGISIGLPSIFVILTCAFIIFMTVAGMNKNYIQDMNGRLTYNISQAHSAGRDKNELVGMSVWNQSLREYKIHTLLPALSVLKTISDTFYRRLFLIFLSAGHRYDEDDGFYDVFKKIRDENS